MKKSPQPVLRRAQIIRLPRLMDMLYKPAELAREIDVAKDTIYATYIPAGLPVIKEGPHYWIHGLTFVTWAKQTVAARKAARPGIAEHEAWCLKCNRPVPLTNPIIKPIKQQIEMLKGTCGTCGKPINRIRSTRRPS